MKITIKIRSRMSCLRCLLSPALSPTPALNPLPNLFPFTIVFTLQLLIPIMQLYEQARTEVVSTVPASATAC